MLRRTDKIYVRPAIYHRIRFLINIESTFASPRLSAPLIPHVARMKENALLKTAMIRPFGIIIADINELKKVNELN